MDLRNFSGIELLYNRIGAFSENFHQKCINWSSIQVFPNYISKKSFYTFKDIDLRESHVEVHKNRVKVLETLTDCTLHSVCLQNEKYI